MATQIEMEMEIFDLAAEVEQAIHDDDVEDDAGAAESKVDGPAEDVVDNEPAAGAHPGAGALLPSRIIRVPKAHVDAVASPNSALARKTRTTMKLLPGKATAPTRMVQVFGTRDDIAAAERAIRELIDVNNSATVQGMYSPVPEARTQSG